MFSNSQVNSLALCLGRDKRDTKWTQRSMNKEEAATEACYLCITNVYSNSQEFITESIICKIIKRNNQVVLLVIVSSRSSSRLGIWEAYWKYHLMNASVYFAKLESLWAWVLNVSWFICLTTIIYWTFTMLENSSWPQRCLDASR